MTDLALFDERGEPTAHARRSDPQTSRDAARSIRAERIRESQAAILTLLKLDGPMTDVELVELYGNSAAAILTPQSDSGIRTRRHELVELGLVVDSGVREKLDSGRRAIVWAAA